VHPEASLIGPSQKIIIFFNTSQIEAFSANMGVVLYFSQVNIIHEQTF
jgi:hypothetical protein